MFVPWSRRGVIPIRIAEIVILIIVVLFSLGLIYMVSYGQVNEGELTVSTYRATYLGQEGLNAFVQTPLPDLDITVADALVEYYAIGLLDEPTPQQQQRQAQLKKAITDLAKKFFDGYAAESDFVIIGIQFSLYKYGVVTDSNDFTIDIDQTGSNKNLNLLSYLQMNDHRAIEVHLPFRSDLVNERVGQYFVEVSLLP